MNKLQRVEYDILLEFDRVCKKHKLSYFLAYGTALGAVRHGGFIPWDDDIDVVMLRDDYERLCSLAASEFSDDYFFQTVYTEEEYPVLFAKLRKCHTTFLEQGFEGLSIHQGIYIDIIPLDHVPSNSIKRLMQRFWAEYAWGMMAKYRSTRKFRKVVACILCRGVKGEGYQDKIRKIEKRMIMEGPSSRLAAFGWGGGKKYAKEYFYTVDFKPMGIVFEDNEFPIMAGYDRVLRTSYGDYMEFPPKEQQKGHAALTIDYERALDEI